MKIYLAIALCFVLSCAPVLCRMDPTVAFNYSEDKAPQKYTSFIYVSYGAVKIPLKLEKDNSKYTIQGPKIPGLSFDKKGLCANGVCLDLPFGPDGIIFGALLTGEEKISCSSEGIILSREVGDYLIRHYFKDAQLSKVEILDKRKERLITLDYSFRTKDGYYKRVKVSVEDFSFTINIEEVSF
ncbi:hypothetical protein [Thermocrinis sp.]|uniref:hypothetical protein n=1 Tax=Thermocrinis sp. TaxID=2024383 RepID=UPI002FDDD3E2